MRRVLGPGTGRSTISGGYTDQMHVVTDAVLDPAAVAAAVARRGDGAVSTFVKSIHDWCVHTASATPTNFARSPANVLA